MAMVSGYVTNAPSPCQLVFCTMSGVPVNGTAVQNSKYAIQLAAGNYCVKANGSPVKSPPQISVPPVGGRFDIEVA